MKLPATLNYIYLEVISDTSSTVNFGNGLDIYSHVHVLNQATFLEVVWRVRLHPFRMLELHGGRCSALQLGAPFPRRKGPNCTMNDRLFKLQPK
jgi:hypothetical protein